MALKAQPLARVFAFNGMELKDPNPQASDTDAVRILSASYPELANAKIEPPKIEGGKAIHNLKVVAATKG
jgi:PRTRC genetic system protein C